eukprot:TRINITY_DN63326_c0_g1_i1.p1 TRINITY_DN63326_c0_g1~~TRINITY_DN63326_c0_g1_i1.p1  ORF type:complete len:406 (-),score=78.33 TRINITY_DN63326_c0_g1_i1:153-1322(-)
MAAVTSSPHPKCGGGVNENLESLRADDQTMPCGSQQERRPSMSMTPGKESFSRQDLLHGVCCRPPSMAFSAFSPLTKQHGEAPSPSKLSCATATPGSAASRDTRLASNTPKTTTSWESRTSIATPEPGVRSFGLSASPSPCADGNSELELALELVNHVPPEVADRLMERLRLAESARRALEARCERLKLELTTQERAEQHEEDEEVALCCLPCLAAPRAALRRAVLAWLLLAAMFLIALAVAWDSSSFEDAGHWHSPARPVNLSLQDDEAEDLACEALLWEAESEAEELRRRQQELEVGYGSVLEAVGYWVAFLQQLPNDRRNKTWTSGPALAQQCAEAAKPARIALEALMPVVAPPTPSSALSWHVSSARLRERLARVGHGGEVFGQL